MKKLFLIALLGLSVTVVSAQGVRFGAKAGGNLSTMTSKYDGTKEDGNKARFGFHLGGVMEYSFSPEFAFQPELLLMFNGTNFKSDEEMGMGVDPFIKLTQLQIPLNLKYKMGTDNLKFFVTAGPYLGYALSGRVGAKVLGISVDEDLFGDDSSFKRFDFGAGVGLGIEAGKMTFGANYQYGLANLSDVDKSTVKMGTFLFSVGYFFKR